MLFNLSEGEEGGERGVLKYFAIVIAATIVGRTISGHGLSVISLFPLFLTLFFLFFFYEIRRPIAGNCWAVSAYGLSSINV